MPQNPGDNPTGEIGLLALEETGENIHRLSSASLLSIYSPTPPYLHQQPSLFTFVAAGVISHSFLITLLRPLFPEPESVSFKLLSRGGTVGTFGSSPTHPVPTHRTQQDILRPPCLQETLDSHVLFTACPPRSLYTYARYQQCISCTPSLGVTLPMPGTRSILPLRTSSLHSSSC